MTALSSTWESCASWYRNSPGIQNLRKLIVENDYNDRLHDPRTKYQIDRYEHWKTSTTLLSVGAGVVAGFNGYKLGKEQFKKVQSVAIYNHHKDMYNSFVSFTSLGVMGHMVPVALRTALFVTFLTGVPALCGVYNNDTDHFATYLISGGLGGALVSCLTTNREMRNTRVRFMAAILGMIPAIPMGILATASQKYDMYIHYDRYKERWKAVDPLWTDYAERMENNNSGDENS